MKGKLLCAKYARKIKQDVRHEGCFFKKKESNFILKY